MTRTVHTGITLFIAFWLVMLSCSAAAQEARLAKSAVGDCKNAADKIGDLGITSMSFRGSMSYNKETGERDWYFQAEPEIHKVDPKGPAAGKLESGDVIVAIEGLPITTRQAGQKFANMVPGASVKLTVRRGGRLVDTAIVPRAVCPEDHPMMLDGRQLAADALGVKLEKLSRLAETEARYDELRAELDRLSEYLDAPDMPGRPDDPDAPPAPFPFVRHRSRFGMSLTAQKTRIRVPKTGGPLEWQFDEPLEVHSVDPGSPAEEAGIQRGDRITHVDGLSIDSKEGGTRFWSIEPGETVEMRIRRNGVNKVIRIKATEQPEEVLEREQEYERALREYEEVAQSHEDRARRMEELARARSEEYQALARAYEHDAQLRGVDPESLPVRFLETSGDSKVEVRGEDSVRVIRDESSGEIVVKTRDAFIRIRLPEKKK